mmetsp:Transcript_7006/g.17942  ORF Transcript_7006/g.17942 Transcript_7006/m.17942 type:complete len:817 (-) Transcript_7006:187-2637(-)
MPLLKKSEYTLAGRPDDLKENEAVYVVPFTSEVFREYDEYLKAIDTYRERKWRCQYTGKSNLTYEEAMMSEEAAADELDAFPDVYMSFVANEAHHSTDTLEAVTEKIYEKLKAEYLEGEDTAVYAKRGNASQMKAIRVVKVVKGGELASVVSQLRRAYRENGEEKMEEEKEEEEEEMEEESRPSTPFSPVSMELGVGKALASGEMEATAVEVLYEVEYLDDGVRAYVLSDDMTRKKHPLPKMVLKKMLRIDFAKDSFPNAPFIASEKLVKKFGLARELPDRIKRILKEREEAMEEKKKKKEAKAERKRKMSTMTPEEKAEYKRRRKEEKKEQKELEKKEALMFPMLEEEFFPYMEKMHPKEHREISGRVLPEATHDFSLPWDQVDRFLSAWMFFQGFASTLAIKTFPIEEFEKSLLSADTSDHQLLNEAMIALLRLCVKLEEEKNHIFFPPDMEEAFSDPNSISMRNWESVMLLYLEGLFLPYEGEEEDESAVDNSEALDRAAAYNKYFNSIGPSAQDIDAIVRERRFRAVPLPSKLTLIHYFIGLLLDKEEVKAEVESKLEELEVALRARTEREKEEAKAAKEEEKKRRQEEREERIRQKQEKQENGENDSSDDSDDSDEDEEEEEDEEAKLRAQYEVVTTVQLRQQRMREQQLQREEEERKKREMMQKEMEERRQKAAEKKKEAEERKKAEQAMMEKRRVEEQEEAKLESLMLSCRPVSLGKDRNFNVYWRFQSLPGRIYVQSTKTKKLSVLSTFADLDALFHYLEPRAKREHSLLQNLNRIRFRLEEEMERSMRASPAVQKRDRKTKSILCKL